MIDHLYHRGRASSIVLCGALCFVVGPLQVAEAQFASDFEAPVYAGAAAGIDLNGQNLFYNPLPAASVSCDVYTYAGNAPGLPANPDGDAQFSGGLSTGALFARSQRDISYGAGIGPWRLSFDVAVSYEGVLPATQNAGSLSTAPFVAAPGVPTNATFIALATWTDPLTAATWNVEYVRYDAAGIQNQTSPGPGFTSLLTDHWYRWTTRFDFDFNTITHVSIEDLTTGAIVVAKPITWWMAGGLPGVLPPPTGFRQFGGGTTAGNLFAIDNLIISCLYDINGDGIIGINDLLSLLANWGPNPGNDADFDNDGVVGIVDLLDLLANWGGCP